LSDGGEVGRELPCEAVRQTPFLVARVGEIKSGFAFEHRLATWNALARQAYGEQRIAHRSTFAHRATAAATTLQVGCSQVDALCERAVNLVLFQPHDLGDGRCGTEDAEQGTGMETPRQDGRDKIRGEAFHNLVAGHDAGQEFTSRATRGFGGHEGRWQDGATGVSYHAEGVPLAAGERHLRIDEGGAGTRKASSVDQRRDHASGALLVFFHEADGLLRFGEFVAQQA
jgi:hypothetical protein